MNAMEMGWGDLRGDSCPCSCPCRQCLPRYVRSSVFSEGRSVFQALASFIDWKNFVSTSLANTLSVFSLATVSDVKVLRKFLQLGPESLQISSLMVSFGKQMDLLCSDYCLLFLSLTLRYGCPASQNMGYVFLWGKVNSIWNSLWVKSLLVRNHGSCYLWCWER